jgi:hypothetical protein
VGQMPHHSMVLKDALKFGINFLEETSRFFAIRAPMLLHPSPRILYLKKQFSAENMLFYRGKFYFSQKYL